MAQQRLRQILPTVVPLLEKIRKRYRVGLAHLMGQQSLHSTLSTQYLLTLITRDHQLHQFEVKLRCKHPRRDKAMVQPTSPRPTLTCLTLNLHQRLPQRPKRLECQV